MAEHGLRRRRRQRQRQRKGGVFLDGPHNPPTFFDDIRSMRRAHRSDLRFATLGVFGTVELRFADFTGGSLASGGALVDEQGDTFRRRKKKKGLGLLFGKQAERGSDLPIPDEGLIVPKELRSKPKTSRIKDALKQLFQTDLAGLSPEAQTFAARELEKIEIGDVVSPEVIQEVFRVAKAASVMVKTPTADGGDRSDQLVIRKRDDELQIVWGEVYVPGLPDSQGDFMDADEIRKAAYSFAANQRLDKIDRMHDGHDCGAFVVETFIAREGDPTFIPLAWVVGVHIPDPEIWEAVKSGEFNGFSLEGKAVRTEKQFEIDLPEEITGRTSTDNEHDHGFTVRFSDQGEFLGGETSADADPTVPGEIHVHKIQKGTVVEVAGVKPHAHRYSISEAILEVSTGRVRPSEDQVG